MLAINLNGVSEEDVICRLFLYTLKGKVSSWYFSLFDNIIVDWDSFGELFL